MVDQPVYILAFTLYNFFLISLNFKHKLKSLIATGYNKSLTKEDMWDLSDGEKCEYLTEKLEKEWNKAAAECVFKKKLIT